MIEKGSAKIIVRGDPEIADLIPRFLENRSKDIQKIQVALEKYDFETIASVGHAMNGFGGAFGFERITQIGRILEGGAKRKDPATIQIQLLVLSDYLSRLEVVYDSP